MIPKQVKNFLTNKKIILNVIDDREIIITEVWDFMPSDKSVGLFHDVALCTTNEGNEVGVLETGEVYDGDNNLIATIESDFGKMI